MTGKRLLESPQLLLEPVLLQDWALWRLDWAKFCFEKDDGHKLYSRLAFSDPCVLDGAKAAEALASSCR
jgi:hypothetical protein